MGLRGNIVVGNSSEDKKYMLSPGTQVREEDFGLLFYTMDGPRLYFMYSGGLLDSDFFNCGDTLEDWMGRNKDKDSVSKAQVLNLVTSLNQLKKKGIIIEC